MIESLDPNVQNVATLLVLLLPGFAFIALFESTNVSFARRRGGWEWGMYSLTLSLPLYAFFTGIYSWADWPHDPIDPQFYLGLFGGAVGGGYALGNLTRTRWIRSLTRWMGLTDPTQTWVDVVGQPDAYVVVHLLDGTVLYGYPSSFTDDPRIEVKEIFLTDVSRLQRSDETDPGEWTKFDGTQGVLVDSSRISFLQLITKAEGNRRD